MTNTDKKNAEAYIANWKRDIDALRDHVAAMTKKLDNMEDLLATAEDKALDRDYRWIMQNLYRLGDLY
jgi:hypothetical protein